MEVDFLKKRDQELCLQRLVMSVLNTKEVRSGRVLECVIQLCDPSLKCSNLALLLFPLISNVNTHFHHTHDLDLDEPPDRSTLDSFHWDNTSELMGISLNIAEYSVSDEEYHELIGTVRKVLGFKDVGSSLSSLSSSTVITHCLIQDCLQYILYFIQRWTNLDELDETLKEQSQPRSGYWIAHHWHKVPVLGIGHLLSEMISPNQLIPSGFSDSVPLHHCLPFITVVPDPSDHYNHNHIDEHIPHHTISELRHYLQCTLGLWFRVDSEMGHKTGVLSYDIRHLMRLMWIRLGSENASMFDGRLFVNAECYLSDPSLSNEGVRIRQVRQRMEYFMSDESGSDKKKRKRSFFNLIVNLPNNGEQIIRGLSLDEWYHLFIVIQPDLQYAPRMIQTHLHLYLYHFSNDRFTRISKTFPRGFRIKNEVMKESQKRGHYMDFQTYEGDERVGQRADVKVWDRCLIQSEMRQYCHGSRMNQGLVWEMRGKECLTDSAFDLKGVPKSRKLLFHTFDNYEQL